MKITIEKNYSGGLVLSSIVTGFRLHRVYYGYSVQWAKKDFKKVIKNELTAGKLA